MFRKRLNQEPYKSVDSPDVSIGEGVWVLLDLGHVI